MSMNPEDLEFMARTAEQTERFEDMITYMT
jgi:hypothetical protein